MVLFIDLCLKRYQKQLNTIKLAGCAKTFVPVKINCMFFRAQKKPQNAKYLHLKGKDQQPLEQKQDATEKL